MEDDHLALLEFVDDHGATTDLGTGPAGRWNRHTGQHPSLIDSGPIVAGILKVPEAF